MPAWLKWIINIIAAFALVAVILIIAGHSYVFPAVWHFTADIDDYKIFANRKVPAGNAEEWPLSRKYNQISLPDSIINQHNELESIAFLVVKNDSIVLEKYWQGYDESTISNSFSMAKTIGGILTGIALKEGKIKSLDQAVGDFLPEFNQREKRKITIRHLLTMTSGLNWQETYISPVSHTTEAYYGSNLRKLINKLKVQATPGTQFRYKSGDTQVLGFVLTEATGKSLSEYASEKLWMPIGAKQDALWSLDSKDGMEKTYCCFNATTRDFARIGQLYLRHGRWDTVQVVPEDYVQQSIQPLMIQDYEGDTTDYYGYSWWILDDTDERVYYARGILGQYIIVLPEYDVVLVRLGEKRGARKEHHWQEVYSWASWAAETFAP